MNCATRITAVRQSRGARRERARMVAAQRAEHRRNRRLLASVAEPVEAASLAVALGPGGAICVTAPDGSMLAVCVPEARAFPPDPGDAWSQAAVLGVALDDDHDVWIVCPDGSAACVEVLGDALHVARWTREQAMDAAAGVGLTAWRENNALRLMEVAR